MLYKDVNGFLRFTRHQRFSEVLNLKTTNKARITREWIKGKAWCEDGMSDKFRDWMNSKEYKQAYKAFLKRISKRNYV